MYDIEEDNFEQRQERFCAYIKKQRKDSLSEPRKELEGLSLLQYGAFRGYIKGIELLFNNGVNIAEAENRYDTYKICSRGWLH
ncbi:hypothetical protein ACFL0U_01395 [Pseudomonadota bacterium]